MPAFPLVERYRAELRHTAYTPLTDAELAEQDDDDRDAVQSLAIEGLYGTPEIEALFAMLREERAPADVALGVVDRYVRERLLPATPEQTVAAAAAS